MEQLSSLDAAYIYAENPKRPMHVTTATIYDPSTAPQGKVRLKEIMGLFEQFNQVGVSVLIASHDLDMISRLPYRVLKLQQGQLVADGYPRGAGR